MISKFSNTELISIYIIYTGVSILIILVPLLVMCGVVDLFYGRDILSFTPTVHDEIMNYQQTLTFMEAGFDGGYFTVNELTGNANFSHFYVWGPAFPILTGAIGNLFSNWPTYAPIIFNIAVVQIALFFFLIYVEPKLEHLLLFS
ncbi:MAG: hypothetical protein OEZ01_17645, partial [Candidatus Heimdallarchaeota archaeon]|nr:hypothetical protein [Candidatus Heimdallarchaeota archaeon]